MYMDYMYLPFLVANWKQKTTKQPNAVVTPLRKAASYEQRKTNLGNQNFAAYYHVVPRITQH